MNFAMSFLNDCISKGPTVAELLIVETKNQELSKASRSMFIQAVLEIDDSILEVQGAPFDKVLNDTEVKSIISSLGAGFVLVPGQNLLGLENLRYGEIIIVTEPTNEGRHVMKQVLSFMHKYMNPVMSAGHVYVVPSQDWSSMMPEEFEAKVMTLETREIVQIPGDWTIEEILDSLEDL